MSKTSQHRIACDKGVIAYELVRTRRKTLGITVHRDGRVTVRAPQNSALRAIETIVRQKEDWILSKQRQFAAYPPPPPPPVYISGERHLYLGRPLALRVTEDRRQAVELRDGRLHLSVRDASDPARKRKLLSEWYRDRAKEIFPARLAACHAHAATHGIPYPELKIRLMKSRWGSCSSTGAITLNLRLVQAPLECIDYVLFHELAHLQVPAHNRAFYALLEAMLPDWRARRQELNRIPIL